MNFKGGLIKLRHFFFVEDIKEFDAKWIFKLI